MLLVLLFLPGTWICYGISRYLLTYLNLPPNDVIALSCLAALVYLLSALMRTWEVWNRVTEISREADKVAKESPQEQS